MSRKVLIVGAGFAGVRGAPGAARALDGAGVTTSDVEITPISPRPELQIWPRLYGSEPERMAAPLPPLLEAVGVKFFEGNVAADLVGIPTLEYKQPFYATCADLGEWGAIYSEGWDRHIKRTHAEEKARKQIINTQWIYRPAPNRAEPLAARNPQASVG